MTHLATNITKNLSISHIINNAVIYPTTLLPRSAKCGFYGFYAVGGDFDIDFIKCTSNETTNPDYIVIGDSISDMHLHLYLIVFKVFYKIN